MDAITPPAPPFPRALLVEDDYLLRIETADLLADEGYEVLEAWNAATALRLLDRYDGIALLLTGVHLSGPCDGVTLARQVRARRPEIAILVVSGADTPGRDDLPAGAVFVGEPLTPGVALAAIRTLYEP